MSESNVMSCLMVIYVIKDPKESFHERVKDRVVGSVKGELKNQFLPMRSSRMEGPCGHPSPYPEVEGKDNDYTRLRRKRRPRCANRLSPLGIRLPSLP